MVSEVIKQLLLTFYLGHGTYDPWYLPFQLCSIPMYAALIAGIARSRVIFDTCTAFISTFGLLGGIFSWFDTTGFYYPLSILTIHSYLWHIILLILGIYTGIHRNKTAFVRPLGVYLLCVLMAEVLNLTLYPLGDINMFYISPRYKMTQAVFVHIARVIGNDLGILVYILSTCIGACLIDLLLNYSSRFLKKSKQSKVAK